MNRKLHRILLYACFATGLGLVTSMDRKLNERSEVEHIYHRITNPIIDQYVYETEDPLDIGSSDGRRDMVIYWQTRLNKCIDADIARWVMIGGCWLVFFGSKAFKKSKLENEKPAEQ